MDEDNPEEEQDQTVVRDLRGLLEHVQATHPDRCLLVSLRGPTRGKPERLGVGVTPLGRSVAHGIRLIGEGVSRHHARIEFLEGHHVVIDEGSANGTFVNGQAVSRHELNDGDVLSFGPAISFRYTVTDAEHEQLLNELCMRSGRDGVTGLLTREQLLDRLGAEISFAARHNTAVSVVLLDLDHFRAFNAAHGNVTGDELLAAIARSLECAVRREDVVARYGGDEFMVLARGAPLGGAAIMAERLRSGLQRTTIEGEGSGKLGSTASAGVASRACTRGGDVAGMLRIAELRLTEAKRRGRNCVVSSEVKRAPIPSQTDED
jgi:diguanylate cyclase (GGDEF)-like protein